MKLIRIDNQEDNGYIIVNVEKIIYIAYFKASNVSNRQAYAQVYFSEGRASIVLDQKQYMTLMLGCEKFAGEE